MRALWLIVIGQLLLGGCGTADHAVPDPASVGGAVVDVEAPEFVDYLEGIYASRECFTRQGIEAGPVKWRSRSDLDFQLYGELDMIHRAERACQVSMEEVSSRYFASLDPTSSGARLWLWDQFSGCLTELGVTVSAVSTERMVVDHLYAVLDNPHEALMCMDDYAGLWPSQTGVGDEMTTPVGIG